MSSGFNTDVARGDRTFHVQTEDRGPQYLSIDTVVYRNGAILQRKSSGYAHFAESEFFSPEALHERVENQHREMIEAIRAGELDAEFAEAEEKAATGAGIQVQLLNATSWLAEGRVSLELEITRRADSQPIAGARVEASIDGALREGRHEGTSDYQGRAKIEFDLPPLGKGDLALVINAHSDSLQDEIRFSMRSRAKSSPPATAS
jgi:hypothetical protein